MARDLNPGDLIITADNTAIVSRTVQSNHHDFVYNFTVANHNNYFVGKQQLWVHNVKAEKCGGGDGSSVIPKRAKPRIEDGNSREGWQHIDERHISGDSSRGPGDLFAPGTTRKQITEAAKDIVAKGTRVSDPSIRMQTFEKRVVINGKRDRVRVVVDSHDNNRVITMFPVRSE